MRKVLLFSATYCTPCKHAEKVLRETLGEDFYHFVEHIDCMSSPALADVYKIRHIPTFIWLDENREAARSGIPEPGSNFPDWLRGDTDDLHI